MIRRFFNYFIGKTRYLDSRVIHEEIERRKEKKVDWNEEESAFYFFMLLESLYA